MEQFKMLLENEILSEEVKQQISVALSEAIEQSKKDLEVDFAKRFENDKIALNEEFQKFLKESVSSEVSELIDDLEKYRNLEIEYATKLEVFKEEYARELTNSIKGFITESITSEVVELKESIQEAKSIQFGKLIFEAFEKEFTSHGFGGDLKSLQNKLNETQEKLTETQLQLSTMEREKIMEGLLSNLSGSKRNIMKTILENVVTEKLVARYEESLKSILSEDVVSPPQNAQNKTDKVEQGVTETVDNSERLNRLRKLSGGKV